MKNVIDRMTSDSYKIIRILYDHKDHLPDGTEYVPFSQVDMARELNLSINTMNKIFKQLDEDDLVHLMEGKRGKYILSDRAKTIIEEMVRLQNKLEGVKRP